MVKKTIVVDILPDGSVKIDAVGFKGVECEKATKFLEDALGVIKTKSKKPEHYTSTTIQRKATQ